MLEIIVRFKKIIVSGQFLVSELFDLVIDLLQERYLSKTTTCTAATIVDTIITTATSTTTITMMMMMITVATWGRRGQYCRSVLYK